MLKIQLLKMQNQEIVISQSNFSKSNSEYFIKRNHQKVISKEKGFNNDDAF